MKTCSSVDRLRAPIESTKRIAPIAGILECTLVQIQSLEDQDLTFVSLFQIWPCNNHQFVQIPGSSDKHPNNSVSRILISTLSRMVGTIPAGLIKQISPIVGRRTNQHGGRAMLRRFSWRCTENVSDQIWIKIESAPVG
jgi:hypothetical protein